MSKEFVTIKTFMLLPEAEAAKMLLERDGIRVFLADAELVAMDWLASTAVGHIKLQVPSSEVEVATALINQIESKRREKQAHGVDDDACLSCGAPMSEKDDSCGKCGWSFADAES